ncbi:hypothetical protein F5Y18DRAFT_371910 [Xylariaceae sp. FL1019]|nr:hypothetical protein F5Y18DRAFT_371910 [Xylariaceae sp. FL1019]
MTSLVAEFLVNPVIRQARRFSLSRSSLTSSPSEPESPLRIAHSQRTPQQDDVISETEEDSYLRDDGEDSVSSRQSSRSSLPPNSRPNSDKMQPDPCRSPSGNPPAAAAETTASLRTALDSLDIATPRPASLPVDRTATPTALDHNAPPATPRRPELPEDDGMSALRKRILDIQSRDIDNTAKAHLMHQLLIERYTRSSIPVPVQAEQVFFPSSPRSFERRVSQNLGPLDLLKFWQHLGETKEEEYFEVSEKDLEPTYVPKQVLTNPPLDTTEHDEDSRSLGCEHYRRNVKLQCSICNRWYTCRFCHDKVESHILIPKETKNMLCMFCGTAQKAGQTCVNCEAFAARYYCDICKLWQNNPDKPTYHCEECGICRIGHGIGKDFYHCKKCCACIAISTRDTHRCIERVTDCNCPICGDYMFTSPKPVCFMKCGHSIHRVCYNEHIKSSYKCPICNKSVENMESQFRKFELEILSQPMPPEYRDTRAIILCHDCSTKSSTQYHFLGLKCNVCQSYNTAQLQVIGRGSETIESSGSSLAQASGMTSSGPLGVASLADTTGIDIRRRHSSVVARPDRNFFDTDADRLARSVSPIPTPTPGHSLHDSTARGYFDVEEEDEDGDILGFWSRVPHSIRSHDGDDDDEDEESGDEMSTDEDELEDDGDESDDEFELLGHR